MKSKIKQTEIAVDYGLIFYDDGNNGALAHCCGVFEIGGFGDPEEHLQVLQEQFNETIEDCKEYVEVDGEENLILPAHFKVPAKPTMADVVELTQDFINDCMVDYNQTDQTQKAFLATTVAYQAHAVEALENLGFVPIKASNRITLWLKKAKGTRN
jgi:hypothetical protein